MTGESQAMGESAQVSDAAAFLNAFLEAQDGAEHRPQQEQMVEVVADALAENVNVIVQAGTGTGKTFGYLIAAVAAGKKVVVSTATKALGEQLADSDVPRIAQFARTQGWHLSAALVKGRSNYVCLDKINSTDALVAEDTDSGDDLFGGTVRPERAAGPTEQDLAEYRSLLEWVKTTDTGDRSDGPTTGAWAWDQVSVTPAACVGAASCGFAEDCFSEKARQDGRDADITITNHALLAADMANGDTLFGDVDAIIVDEVHELERALSDAWGAVFDPVLIARDLKMVHRLVRKTEDGPDVIDSLGKDLTAMVELLDTLDPGRLGDIPANVALLLHSIHTKGTRLYGIAAKALETHSDGPRFRGTVQTLTDHLDAMKVVLSDTGDYVRWAEIGTYGNATIKAAPLQVGTMLMQRLGNRTLVATSATCTVGGSFDRLVDVLGLPLSTTVHGEEVALRSYRTVDVGTPYDWAASAMLYVPGEGFPVPVGAERAEHSGAVLSEVADLVTAAGGRTLFLSTTTAGARRMAEYLRERVPVNVYAHGDGTAGQLTDAFVADETSVLCATMGHFAGVNAAGPTCSLVIIDKIPFPHADDPLSAARSEAVDAAGGSGFYAVSVTHAALLLAQGAGRLIRTASDKGVIAVLDPRLMTKRYGTTLRNTLPNVGVHQDKATVTAALTRLTGGMPDPDAIPAPMLGTRPSRTRPSRTSAAARGGRNKTAKKGMLTQVTARKGQPKTAG